MLTKKTKFTIGRLANAAGVNIETVRYYQKIGLLDRPEKPQLGGFRAYSESDVWRIRLIKRAQELEFTLAEIARLLASVESGECGDLRNLARGKIEVLTTRIQALEVAKETLDTLVKACPVGNSNPCPFMDWLAGNNGSALRVQCDE